MRIRWVRAIAFGGLVDQTLTLHEGLNVVVGPNESGKSTWHAALYAALCGRTEELETAEDSEFDRRPWQGPAGRSRPPWTATVTTRCCCIRIC